MSTWNPGQYERFAAERRLPFDDLLALVQPHPHMRIVDLGCGTGSLTRILHERMEADETLGIDDSETMLSGVGEGDGGLHFERCSIESFVTAQPFDLVFSNAALHWLPDHEALFPRIGAMVVVGGQLAVQMPANEAQPSHTAAASVAGDSPFAEALNGYVKVRHVLEPHEYARLLHGLGFRELTVRLQVYTHRLDDTRGVVEWVKGSLLTDYQRRMPAELWPQFVARYTERLIEMVGDHAPYLLTYDRVLIHGVKG